MRVLRPTRPQLLSDLGASVVKVEDSRNGGDLLRQMGCCAPDGNSVTMHALNRGKRSVALDFRAPGEEVRLLLQQLVRQADVVVEGFVPGVFWRVLGMTPQELRDACPQLVLCQVSAAGQHGPLSEQPMHDMNALAESGAMSVLPQERMGNTPVPFVDYASGYTACIMILAALRKRDSAGCGSFIDVSMVDCARALTHTVRSVAAFRGDKEENGGNLLAGSLPCYCMYPTREGFLACGCLEPHFWKRFVELIGAPKELAYQGLVQGAQADSVKEQVEGILKARTAAEWSSLCFAEKLPVNEVVRISEASHSSSITAKDGEVPQPLFLEVPSSSTSSSSNAQALRTAEPCRFPVPPNGLHVDGAPLQRLEAGPTLGEGNEDMMSKDGAVKLWAKL